MQALAPGFDGVLHFAALALVGESVEHPERYYRTNVAGTLNLLEAMVAHNVPRLVFSSTCAVYGQPDEVPIPESAPPRPQNAYGASKLAADHLIGDFCVAYGIGAVSLRYFNVAGAHDGIGEDHEPETHLIPNILKVPLGQRDSVEIFGTDYPTPDGTAVRDYIHIDDLADAHALALAHARAGEHRIFNLGNGNGFSVREVIAAAEQVTGTIDPCGRGAAPPRRPAEAGRRRPEDPRRARLGAAEARARDDDRRRLGLRPGAPARLQRQLSPGSTTRVSKVRQRRQRLRHDLLSRQRGVEHADALRLGGGELQVRALDAREELVALALETVGRFPPCIRTRLRGCRIERQQQGAIRRQSAGGEQVELAHRFDPEAAAAALVGERGVDEAVEQHPLAALQRRLQRLLDELGAGGGVEQRLGARPDAQRRVLDERAHGLGGLHAPRLAQQPRLDAGERERLAAGRPRASSCRRRRRPRS